MKTQRGFTLLELLISMTIFAVILVIFAEMLSSTLNSWNRMSDRNVQFREAKAAFDSIQDRLSSAEINPYWGFEFGNGTSNSPTSYKKLSDLHFVCGTASGSAGTPNLIPGGTRPGHAIFFHGTFGITEEPQAERLGSLLNSWGYFLEFDSNEDDVATFVQTEGRVAPRFRYRLMELQLNAEDVTTFKNRSGSLSELDLDEAESSDDLFSWFAVPINEGKAHPVAENIIALIIAPVSPIEGDETELAPNYYYDTRAGQHSTNVLGPLAELSNHQLPPIVRITMVAISEESAQRLSDQSSSTAPDLGVGDLFKKHADYRKDLETLEATLIAQNISFRIFTNTVKLRNARWSKSN